MNIKQTEFRVREFPVFKLKDKSNKDFIAINFTTLFGFIPETILIEKVRGENNKIQIKAILTPAEMIKEDEYMKKLKVEEKKDGKQSNFQIK